MTTLNVLAGLCAGVVASTAGAVGIDFDADAVGNPIVAPSLFFAATALRGLYAPLGVHFDGPGVPNDGGAILDMDGNFGVPAHSGRNFLAFNCGANHSNGGTALDPEFISFDVPVTGVSIWAASGFDSGRFVMTAYDAGGVEVDQRILSTDAGEWDVMAVSFLGGIKSVKLQEFDSDCAFVYDDLLTRTNPGASIPLPGAAGLASVGIMSLGTRRRRGGA